MAALPNHCLPKPWARTKASSTILVFQKNIPMSLSSSTLSAIQKAGAAAFAADAKLKSAVKEYADRVNAAIGSNPYALGNDALFENWKTVARLSKTIAGIEEEIKKVFQVAAAMTADDQPTMVQVPALAAPTRSVEESVESRNDLTPTDVVIKPKRKASKPKTRASAVTTSAVEPSASVSRQADMTPTDVLVKTKIKASPAKTRAPKAKSSPRPTKLAGASGRQLELSGNPAKLLRHFENLLNSNEFTVISQTAIGQATGIPIGSMTAATKKLIDNGRIIAGPTGSFMLANSQQPLAK